MLNCKEATFLASQQLDTKLPLLTRMGLFLHMMMCKNCAAFRKQISCITKIVRQSAASLEFAPEHADAKLSDESRERIRRFLALKEK